MKKVLGYKGKIAAISPCVAKIEEFRETGLVDYNVTMEHLRCYFEENGVKLPEIKIFNTKITIHLDLSISPITQIKKPLRSPLRLLFDIHP